MASRLASHSGFVFGRAFLVAVSATLTAGVAFADEAGTTKAESKPAEATKAASSGGGDSQKSSSNSTAALLKEATKVPGLVPLYKKDDKLYAELSDAMLGKEFFVLTSIARGIGERSLLGGMSYGSGDDWVWEFRKVNDAIQSCGRTSASSPPRGAPRPRRSTSPTPTACCSACRSRARGPVAAI